MKRNRYDIKKEISILFLLVFVIILYVTPKISASPADLNSDNKVNATDIQLIIRWILGLDQSNNATEKCGSGIYPLFQLE